MRAAQIQQVSTAHLLAQAEQLYLARDTVRLSQVANELSNITHPGARAARDFYRAMVLYRAGESEQAWPLIVSASECAAAPRYQARAIQAISIEHLWNDDIKSAISTYREAIKAARAASDPVAFVRAGFTLSEVQSKEGDHHAALEGLRAIRPAVEVLGKAEPFYLHFFANEVAFELLQAGRIEEARRFSLYALAAPYARAYPEWRETAQEIEQAREPIAAHKSILRVETKPTGARDLPRPPRTLFLIRKIILKASRHRLQPRIAIFTRELPRIRPTLEQVSLKIKIRAPSF